MLNNLFKLKLPKITINQYLIGYQRLIVIEKKLGDSIIVDKVIRQIFLIYPDLYFFKTYQEMEKELDILVTNTNDDFLVIITN